MLQKLEPLLDALLSTVQNVSIDSVTFIDSSQGGPAMKTAGFLEQLKAASGVDVAKAVGALTKRGESDVLAVEIE